MIQRLLPILVVFLLLPGCEKLSPANSNGSSTQQPQPKAQSPIRFENVTTKVGIDFVLTNNGKTPLNILETAGGGCAFLDYNQDTWQDILLVGPGNLALYKNNKDGTFEDQTKQSGFDTKKRWMGCAVGDYDGDGRSDVFLTGYKCFALYRNTERGFVDVTVSSGISGLDWSLSAAFADFNSDGKLDLYISQYLKFDSTTQQLCQLGQLRSACGPEVYSTLSGKMYLNVGGGKFKQMPWKDTGKTWGALVSDLLGTGRPAIYLANDMMPGDLWVQKNGKWVNIGSESATAFDANGQLQGGMGVDSGDYDNDGKLDLFVTNYFMQAASLYHNDGNGFFTVTSSVSGIGPPTMRYVKFGTGFVDFDNDGWLDIFIVNGHVRDNVKDYDRSQDYAQPMQMFRNIQGRFEDHSESLLPLTEKPIVGRGISFSDYDKDGKIDVLVTNLEGKSLLLKNVTDAGHWVKVRLNDMGGNRQGLGAMITLKAGETSYLREIRTAGSVMSALEPAAYFGLGKDASPPLQLSIRWQDGFKQSVQIETLDKDYLIDRKMTHVK